MSESALSSAPRVAVLLLANAHLVYAAFSSQPACVAHLKVPDGSPDHFRAAKSGC